MLHDRALKSRRIQRHLLRQRAQIAEEQAQRLSFLWNPRSCGVRDILHAPDQRSAREQQPEMAASRDHAWLIGENGAGVPVIQSKLTVALRQKRVGIAID